jgi:hypothetical protein
MSAKHAKKSAKKAASPAATPTPASEPIVSAGATVVAGADPGSSWMDSADPRKRTIGKIVLIGVWVYVAALWLLALDQTFDWGIFGPKVPPVP